MQPLHFTTTCSQRLSLLPLQNSLSLSLHLTHKQPPPSPIPMQSTSLSPCKTATSLSSSSHATALPKLTPFSLLSPTTNLLSLLLISRLNSHLPLLFSCTTLSKPHTAANALKGDLHLHLTPTSFSITHPSFTANHLTLSPLLNHTALHLTSHLLTSQPSEFHKSSSRRGLGEEKKEKRRKRKNTKKIAKIQILFSQLFISHNV